MREATREALISIEEIPKYLLGIFLTTRISDTKSFTIVNFGLKKNKNLHPIAVNVRILSNTVKASICTAPYLQEVPES